MPEAGDAGATEYQDDPHAEVFGTAGDQERGLSITEIIHFARPNFELWKLGS